MSAKASIVTARSHAALRARGVASPRLLILTSGLGAGHARAARAVELAVLGLAPDADIQTLDLWSLMHPDAADAVRRTYLRLVQEYPHVYERAYLLDDRTWRRVIGGEQPPPQPLREFLDRVTAILAERPPLGPRVGPYALDCVLLPLLCSSMPRADGNSPLRDARVRLPLLDWIWTRLSRRLQRRVLAFRPDVVVATQMVPAALLSTVKLRRGLTVPCVGVPTDYGVHGFWIQPGTDVLCAAHPDIAGLDRVRDIRVSVTGVPLMPGFAQPMDEHQAKAALGLDPTRGVVLVLGGGLGIGVAAVAERLFSRPCNAQYVVITGNDRAAHAELAARHPTLRLVGWTDDMDTHISAADIVVGKPGGLTVAEVLACGRVLFATRSLGGQEGFNLRFLEQQGVGRLLADDTLPAHIEACLADPQRLAALKRRAWSVGRRDGAGRIAAIALELAQSGKLQSVSLVSP